MKYISKGQIKNFFKVSTIYAFSIDNAYLHTGNVSPISWLMVLLMTKL